jgi:hypothetical protein
VRKEREEYETRASKFSVNVYGEDAYKVGQGGALLLMDGALSTSVQADRTRSIDRLVHDAAVALRLDASVSEGNSCLCLHLLKPRDAGKHVYPINGADTQSPSKVSDSIPDGAVLLLYNGSTVGGVPVRPGAEHAPLLVNAIKLPIPDDGDLFTKGSPVVLPSSATFVELLETLQGMMGNEARGGFGVDDIQVFSMETSCADDPKKPLRISYEKPDDTLADIKGLFDGMTVSFEISSAKIRARDDEKAILDAAAGDDGDEPLAVEAFAWRQGKTRLIVRNVTVEGAGEVTIDLESWMSMGDLKSKAISLFPAENLPEEGRVRIAGDGYGGGDQGGFLITDESLTLSDLQLEQNTVVLLEDAKVKKGKEVFLDLSVPRCCNQRCKRTHTQTQTHTQTHIRTHTHTQARVESSQSSRVDEALTMLYLPRRHP